ncbi:triphosphate tunnel metalloenzyme 3-like [Mercurialis annua]|uniref:triphosphate tunnel metalloenzyme 3-like n=1 Tax=Mercurialis annua TaxID=3986 RepID=UPI00215EC1F0|nr:triphosphate tunnel metalloenzyme 3-like [Mercurialis annua]
MEVEVKLRLPNSESHQKLSNILSPFHTQTLIQENIFFDTPTSHLASNLAILRLRFYNQDSHCTLTLKSKPTLANGISRIEEQEEPVDPLLGRMCVAEPRRLWALERSKIMMRVAEEFRVGGDDDDDGLVCLGGFKNVRQVFDWRGLKLEVDESVFEFGICYEIECESEVPEEVQRLIEELLIGHGIDFCYSESNKFAVFLSGKLP